MSHSWILVSVILPAHTRKTASMSVMLVSDCHLHAHLLKKKKNDLVLNVSGMSWVILKGNSGLHGGLVSQKNSKQLFSRITKHLLLNAK